MNRHWNATMVDTGQMMDVRKADTLTISPKIPEFFIVGAPKCGTTSLYDWLGKHPHIYTPHKEACFFSQDIFPTEKLATHIPSLEAYKEIFATAPSQNKISGEATPKYLYSDQALSTISSLRGDARIIVCLRDPVELAISYHSQKLKEGEETERSFERAWLYAMDAKTGKPVSEEPEVRGRINYYFWARIGARLEALYEYFPTDKVKIVLLGELKSDPRAVYVDVVRFLGLDDDGNEDFAPKNERVNIRSIWLHQTVLRTKSFFEPILRPLRRLNGGRGFGVLTAVNSINMARGQYSSPVSKSFRHEMYAILHEDIRLAESYLDNRVLVDGLTATPTGLETGEQ